MFKTERPDDTGEICARLTQREPCFFRQSSNVRLLPSPDLEDHDALRREMRFSLGQETPIIIKPVLTTDQRTLWLMIPHFRHQSVEIRRPDVRGITQDDIELPPESRKPVSCEKRTALGEGISRCIFAGESCGGWRKINPDPERLLIFTQRGQQQAACPGAEIENGSDFFPLRA